MRRTYILSILLIFFGVVLQAQTIHPYIAIVKTRDGKQKGILLRVTSDALVLERGDSVKVIKATDIRNIRIRASKKPYTYKAIFKYDPWDENNFEKVPNSQVRVRKWNEKDPTTGEEIAGHVGTAVVNTTINLIAAPISAINSSIEKIEIKQSIDLFNVNKANLQSYSTSYQANPDYEGELKKIKAISKALSDNNSATSPIDAKGKH